jgi:hypothetical protein
MHKVHSVRRETQSVTNLDNRSQGRKNVTFAEAVTGSSNSHLLRQGGILPPKPIPANPYNRQEMGTRHAQTHPQMPARLDKTISLKKNNVRQHIHRYTLRFKSLKPKSEDEGQQIIKDSLQRFLEIVLQAEPKTILPPYLDLDLDLDWNDKSVPDLSSAFSVSSIDSFHVLKKYFFLPLSKR